MERNAMAITPNMEVLAKTIVAILENHGFRIASGEVECGHSFALPAEWNGRRYAIGCQTYTHSRRMVVSDPTVLAAAKELAGTGGIPLLVMAGVVSAESRGKIAGQFPDLILLDIRNLLYMARNDKGLYDDLLASLPYSVDGLEPVEPGFLSVRPGMGKTRGFGTGAADLKVPGSGYGKTVSFDPQPRSNGDLRTELENWKGGKGVSASGDYEKLCVRVLKRLFAGDLTIWQDQARSNAGLYRFDLICKIKRDNRKDFWEVAERHFGSKYIIFEFKNYSQLVTQKEIFTTVRYLYTKALRGVAIILSPNGIDENADIAIRGILRDEGKLILTLTNGELIGMLGMQERGEDPADYLSDKLDALLIDLEK